MNKKNQGFTLIELLIAIAVLSTMAGVLFQVFAVSGKMGMKARQSEVVQDVARKTMEELKGYSFGNIDTPAGNVTIAGTTYSFEPLPAADGEGTPAVREGYLLKSTYGVSSSAPAAQAKYLIYAEADRGIYSDDSEEAKAQAYSINKYQMPNIADVSSSQNVVVEPQMIVKDKTTSTTGDALRVAELLEKVNKEEETGDGSETEPVYDESDVKKFLHLDLEEKSEKLFAEMSAIYTVGTEENLGSFDADLSITFSLASFAKKIVIDEKTGKSNNRIYVFLPEKSNGEVEKLFVTTNVESVFELYVAAPEEDKNVDADDYIFISTTGATGENIELYTNMSGGNKLVSYYQAEDRLYHLTVTVYEADYSGGTGSPKPGKELLRLDSSKSE